MSYFLASSQIGGRYYLAPQEPPFLGDLTLPYFPMGATITIDASTSSLISFSYPSAIDNLGVVGYEISQNGGLTWQGNGLALSGTFFNLSPGAPIVLAVRAFDGAGNYSLPLLLATSTQPSAPSAPRDVRALAVELGVLVTFDGPAISGGFPVTSYLLTASTGQTLVVGGSPAVFALPAKVPVSITVQATNQIGTGPASPASNVVVPIGFAPNAPTNVSVRAVVGGILVDADDPLYVGSGAISGYRITASSGAFVDVSSLPATLTLPALVSANVTVAAINVVGAGLVSKKSATVTPLVAPGEGKVYSTEPAPRKRVIRV